jgi:hypothetical protein
MGAFAHVEQFAEKTEARIYDLADGKEQQMEEEPILSFGDLAWVYKRRAESALAQGDKVAYLIYDALNSVFERIVSTKTFPRELALQRFLKKLEGGKWPVADQVREQAAPLIAEAISDMKSLLELLALEETLGERGEEPAPPRIRGSPYGMVYAVANLGLSQEEQEMAAKNAVQELEIRSEQSEAFIGEWIDGYRIVNNAKRPPRQERKSDTP